MSNNSFTDWLRENPMPRLEDLVRQHGTFNRIPPVAWAAWEQCMADWRARYRDRHLETPLTRTAARQPPASETDFIGGSHSNSKGDSHGD